MATWNQFVDEAPELAAAIRARLDATKHHVLATVRPSGAPRVSGTEVDFHRGYLTLGSMPGAVKARDLQRDPRFALHANPGDGSMEGGDAKLAGRAVEVPDEQMHEYLDHAIDVPGPFHFFLLELDEAVLTALNDTRSGLEIQLWRPGSGVVTFHRQ